MDIPIEDIEGYSLAKEVPLTPLHFIDDLGPCWDIVPALPFINRISHFIDNRSKRSRNDRLPAMMRHTRTDAILTATLLSYAGVHVLGWNINTSRRCYVAHMQFYSLRLRCHVLVCALVKGYQ